MMIRRMSAALLAGVLSVSAFAQAALSDGEVRKVDKSTGKITLKHGEIKNLDMPPMTMVFTVKDKSVLENVKAGDRIRFAAVSENGQIFVTAIEAVQK